MKTPSDKVQELLSQLRNTDIEKLPLHIKDEIFKTFGDISGIHPSPTYIRIPKSRKRCPYSGYSRSGMIDLVLPSKRNNFKPPVRSKVIKRPGTSRGIRLIDYESLMNYLESIPYSDQNKSEFHFETEA